MFCGSCMHDNTWARALMAAGCEVSLVPTYTPVRVDEADESLHKVFLGGLNVYLNGRWSWWRHIPRGLTRWLDRPGVIRWATQWSVSNDARELGDLTLSMLAGGEGPQRGAIDDLVRFLTRELRADVVIFSNALLSGAVPMLREQFSGPILCTLQGDDVFLDSLPEAIRQEAIRRISAASQGFDGFLVHSRFYRDYISEYLRLPVERFHTMPLGIDFVGNDGLPGEREESGPFTVGYFARVAPEKGLHHLVDAFEHVRRECPEARLRVGGYLAAQNREYFREIERRVAGWGEQFEYVGSPGTHEEKVQFFRSIDVLSVPTHFLEPKGLYVLEGLANGVPAVQPRHGAFPEIIDATAGGLLVTPHEPQELAGALSSLVERDRRLMLAREGHRRVREVYSLEAMAHRTLEILTQLGGDQQPCPAEETAAARL